MTKIITFDLMQNAIDSINYAVDLLAYENDINSSTLNKRAILAISHALELLLKERLRRIHPSLVWENVDKYPSLEARTVGSNSALNRLQKIGGLEFSDDDKKLLRSIQKTRNAIEHYSWSISNEEAEYIVGTSLGFVTYFMEEHLGQDLLGYAERDGGTMSDLMSNNKAFSNSHKKRCKNKNAETYKPTNKCIFCKALTQENDDGVCSICGHWDSNKYKGYGSFSGDDIPF